MKKILVLLLLASCQSLPQMFQSIEDIANDDSVNVMISREAMAEKKEVKLSIDITAQDSK